MCSKRPGERLLVSYLRPGGPGLTAPWACRAIWGRWSKSCARPGAARWRHRVAPAIAASAGHKMPRSWCDSRIGVGYIVALAKNKRLNRFEQRRGLNPIGGRGASALAGAVRQAAPVRRQPRATAAGIVERTRNRVMARRRSSTQGKRPPTRAYIVTNLEGAAQAAGTALYCNAAVSEKPVWKGTATPVISSPTARSCHKMRGPRPVPPGRFGNDPPLAYTAGPDHCRRVAWQGNRDGPRPCRHAPCA